MFCLLIEFVGWYDDIELKDIFLVYGFVNWEFGGVGGDIGGERVSIFIQKFV